MILALPIFIRHHQQLKSANADLASPKTFFRPDFILQIFAWDWHSRPSGANFSKVGQQEEEEEEEEASAFVLGFWDGGTEQVKKTTSGPFSARVRAEGTRLLLRDEVGKCRRS